MLEFSKETPVHLRVNKSHSSPFCLLFCLSEGTIKFTSLGSEFLSECHWQRRLIGLILENTIILCGTVAIIWSQINYNTSHRGVKLKESVARKEKHVWHLVKCTDKKYPRQTFPAWAPLSARWGMVTYNKLSPWTFPVCPDHVSRTSVCVGPIWFT